MSSVFEHASPQEMADSLAVKVSNLLASAIAERGGASLAVPGGGTPRLFLRALGACDLDWQSITVTLTDERCVPETSERSNARLVRETLLVGQAASAAFMPLFGDGSLKETAAALRLPLDVAVFGMGEDFHTASLFPGADGTAAALDPECRMPLARIRPASQDEERVTLTAPPILACRSKFLIMHGASKKEAYRRARAVGTVLEAPVNILFEGEGETEIHIAA